MSAHKQGPGSPQLSVWTEPGQGRPERGQVVNVPVAGLAIVDSPRTSGENSQHLRALAAVDRELPPIIVHRETMHVIDGAHRLRAAKLRGDLEIPAVFFSGCKADAFVLAVKSNITHGLSLSLNERKAAAKRIIMSHQQWSNRMIASVTGLAPATVAEMRDRCADREATENARIGQDGRVRPVNSAERRRHASELITQRPELSLRQVAQASGISPETVRDVRNRLRRGEDPVPPGSGVKGNGKAAGVERPMAEMPRIRPAARKETDYAQVVGRLSADPALRFSETGRSLLRLLHLHFTEIKEWNSIAENVPAHCSAIIATLGRECAQMWEDLADQAAQKAELAARKMGEAGLSRRKQAMGGSGDIGTGHRTGRPGSAAWGLRPARPRSSRGQGRLVARRLRQPDWQRVQVGNRLVGQLPFLVGRL
jgi:ParB-like chromosome segregation protein Spo0J